MNAWNGHHVNILSYLDKELGLQQREDISIHFRVCTYCRARLEEEQAFSRLLQRTRPLYSAPAALRAQLIAAVVERCALNRTSRERCQRLLQRLKRSLGDIART